MKELTEQKENAMSNFIVTADTTMDLPMETIRELNIHPIVSYVSMGGDNLPDWPELTSRDLFDYVAKSGQLPKTAAASPTDYEAFFRKLRDRGFPVHRVEVYETPTNCAAYEDEPCR